MGPTADQVEGNSPAEELERSNSGGNDKPASDQQHSASSPGKSELPGGPSGDADASGRAAKKTEGKGEEEGGETAGDSSGESASKSGSGGVGGQLRRVIGTRRRKLAAAGAAALVSIIIAVFGAFGYLSLELVHVGTDIAHYFEKRMAHTLQSREGTGYKKVFEDAPAGATTTGEPIDDAYHSYSMDQFKIDADIKSVNFDSAGTVVSFTTNEGEVLHLSDATLNDPSSPLMEHLGERFPEVPFFDLSERSRILDADWGIERKLLSNADEPITEDTTALEKETEQAFDARETDSDGVTTNKSAAIDQAQSDLQDAAAQGPDAEGTGLKAEAASGVPGAKLAVIGCATKSVASDVNKGLVVYRSAQLMRVAVAILSTAAQIKRGDVHASQVGVLAKKLIGFAKAASWGRLSGSNPSAQISTSDLNTYGPYGGNAVASTIGSVGGKPLGTFCGLVNSEGALVAIIGADVVGLFSGDGTILDGIWELTQSVGSTVGQSVIFSFAAQQLVGVVTEALKGPAVSLATSASTDIISASISGSDSYFNASAMSNGGERLSGAQVTQLNQEADAYDAHYAQQKGLAYQLFSPNYDHSLVSALMDRAPTSPDDLTSGVNSMVAAISSPFNGKELASIGSFFINTSPSASASGYSPADQQEDPSGWGVPQFGFPDSLLEQYPDPETNEKWVLKDLCKQGQTLYTGETFDSNCNSTGGNGSGELTDQNDTHDDAYHNFVAQCLTNVNPVDPSDTSGPNGYLSGDCQSGGPKGFDGTPSYDHFRVYRLDLGIANMIVSYNNNNNDQSDPDANASGGSGSPGGNLPPGNAQALAKDILANSSVVYEGTAQTDMQDAADGKPGTCNAPLSTTLLQLLDYLAKAGESFHISALESGCQGHSSGADPHYAGRAADITQVDGDPLITGTAIGAGGGRTANDVKVMNELAPLMLPSPNTSDWTQWSGFGQQGCGPQPDPTLPNNIHQFADLCNHLHIQVAP